MGGLFSSKETASAEPAQMALQNSGRDEARINDFAATFTWERVRDELIANGSTDPDKFKSNRRGFSDKPPD